MQKIGVKIQLHTKRRKKEFFPEYVLSSDVNYINSSTVYMNGKVQDMNYANHIKEGHAL